MINRWIIATERRYTAWVSDHEMRVIVAGWALILSIMVLGVTLAASMW